MRIKSILLILLLMTGCTSKAAEEKILVKINGTVITLPEFEEEFSSARSGYGSSYPADRETMLKLKSVYLKQMIVEKLILLEAKRLGLAVGAEEVDAAISVVKRDYSDEKTFKKIFTDEYLNFDVWKEKIKTKLLIEKVVFHSVISHINISKEEVEDFYNASEDDFKMDEQVRARQIVLKEEKDAVEARRRIKAGEDFATVAKEVSLSPDADDGGNLGFFSRGVMPIEFDKAIFPLKVGTLSEVVRSPYGFHVFLVEEKKKARDLSVDDVRNEIIERLKRLKTEKLYMKFIADIKKKADIEINKELINNTSGGGPT